MIEITDLTTTIADVNIHQHLNLTIERGEICAIAGGSGSGKTTLLRAIMLLLRPDAGSIKINGVDIMHCTAAEINTIRKLWGVMFQHSALFADLTVLENVLFPLQQFTTLSVALQQKLALIKIHMAGLDYDAAKKYPAELSGGMQKRAALARALALDPPILLLDEPTAGLDPHSASLLDELLLNLKSTLGLTIIMVTHDVDSLYRVADNIAFLAEGKVVAKCPFKELAHLSHPAIQDYFNNSRIGRILQ